MMYGAQEVAAAASGTGGTLAVTGMATGWWLLAAAGAVFLVLGAWLLLRKPGEHRP